MSLLTLLCQLGGIKLDEYKVKKLAENYDMTVEEFKEMIRRISRKDITKEEVEKMVAGTK